MAQTTTVLVVGVTGMLGTKIAEALLAKDGVAVRALVRNKGEKDEDKRKQLEALQSEGVQLVEGDLQAPDSLPDALRGADVVISAVSGDRDSILDGQMNLLEAAQRAGVRRMLPSDYSVDYLKIDLGDNYNLDLRIRVAQALRNQNTLEYTFMLNGAFMDTLTSPMFDIFVDLKKGLVRYWGDGTQKCDYTSVADAARYTAEAALDPQMANQPCRVAGDVLDAPELRASLERATGRKFTAQSQGTVEELRAWIAERKQSATSPLDYLREQYHYTMVSGKGKLEPLDNARYPHIRPSTMEEFVRQQVAS